MTDHLHISVRAGKPRSFEKFFLGFYVLGFLKDFVGLSVQIRPDAKITTQEESLYTNLPATTLSVNYSVTITHKSRLKCEIKYCMHKIAQKTRCRAIAGRTARCRYKFRHNGIVHAVTVVQHGFLV